MTTRDLDSNYLLFASTRTYHIGGPQY